MERNIKIKNLKGTTDFLPSEQAKRNKIIDILKNTFVKYGYMPLETPMLNEFSLLKYKYKENAEILHEIYTLTDQGKREIGLRYDLTIPFCKVIALNKDLQMPFRRYEIGKVFRDGPVKAGRAREFYQCDVDVVGIDGRFIELEQMQMAINAYKELGIDVIAKWNNHKLMVGLLEVLNIETNKIDSVIGLIDRLEKISKDELYEEFTKLEISKPQVDKLLSLFSKTLSEYNALFSNTQNINLKDGLMECNEIQSLIEKFGLENNAKFSSTLARGLGIYTGTIFEFFDKQNHISSSLGGGGRYDKIITDFMDNGINYPAVGLCFGLEPIFQIVTKTENESFVDVLLIPMGTEFECFEIANKLRKTGARVIVELTGKKIKKAFDYANKAKIKYVMTVGENEINSKMYAIKNMEKGEQVLLPLEEIINIFNKNK